METAVIVLSDILVAIVIGGGFSIRHYMVNSYSEILKKDAPGKWDQKYGYGFGSMLSDMFGSVQV